jgi:hypothetical protein
MDRRQFIQGATLLALAPEMQKLHAQALPARAQLGWMSLKAHQTPLDPGSTPSG